MSYPLHELRRQLSARASTVARVVRREGSSLTCATPGGRRDVISGPGVRPGDRVIIRDGVAYRAPRTLLKLSV